MGQEADNAGGGMAFVHLALNSYGIEPFREFLDSYRAHPAGIDHELVVALKGFAREEDAASFVAELGDIPHRLMFVPDRGFDIGSYFHVAAAADAAHYCFCNSRTVIAADGYLAKLFAALAIDGVGAVSATASYQSLADHYLRATHRNRLLRPLWKLKGMLQRLNAFRFYPGFPNPHLRTNALMIARTTLERIRVREIRTKADAMHFESGWMSLSRQIQAMGLEVRLADARGRSLPVSDWEGADVFWQRDQADLLVSDNQTALYAAGSEERRRELRGFAWQRPRLLRG